MIEIKSRWTGHVIRTVQSDTLVGADLVGADLRGAVLRDAKLSGAALADIRRVAALEAAQK